MAGVLALTAGSVLSGLAAMAIRPALGTEIFLGMAGPLLAVTGTWLVVDRTARTNPAGLTPVMLTAFVAKMIFFALYVVFVVTAAGVERTPFVVSFTGYFVILYGVEAAMLGRLFGRLAR